MEAIKHSLPHKPQLCLLPTIRRQAGLRDSRGHYNLMRAEQMPILRQSGLMISSMRFNSKTIIIREIILQLPQQLLLAVQEIRAIIQKVTRYSITTATSTISMGPNSWSHMTKVTILHQQLVINPTGWVAVLHSSLFKKKTVVMVVHITNTTIIITMAAWWTTIVIITTITEGTGGDSQTITSTIRQ